MSPEGKFEVPQELRSQTIDTLEKLRNQAKKDEEAKATLEKLADEFGPVDIAPEVKSDEEIAA